MSSARTFQARLRAWLLLTALLVDGLVAALAHTGHPTRAAILAATGLTAASVLWADTDRRLSLATDQVSVLDHALLDAQTDPVTGLVGRRVLEQHLDGDVHGTDPTVRVNANREHMNTEHEPTRISTWTFFGHWEGDRIVVEHTQPGIVADTRVDTGTWPEGLWAASGRGTTIGAAQANATAEYLDAAPPRSDYHAALDQSLTTLGTEWPATLAAEQRTRALTLAFTAGWTAAKATGLPAPATGLVTIGRLPASAIMPGDTIRFIDPVHQYSAKDGGFRRRSYGGWTHVHDVGNSECDPHAETLIERIANDDFVLLRVALHTLGAPSTGERFLALPRHDLVHVQLVDGDR